MLFFLIIASIAIVVVTAAVVIVARGMLKEMHKVGQASEEMSEFMRAINEEISPIAKNASAALSDIDTLVIQTTKTIERLDKVACGAERLIETADMATAATKVAKSTAAELISVYEGVKRGIKTLRGS